MNNRSAIILLFLALTAFSCQGNSASSLNKTVLSTANEIKALNTITQQDSKNVVAWRKLGNSYMDAGRYNEAISAFSHVVELTPDNLNVAVDMGTCYRYAGMPDRAVQIYRKVLSVDPANRHAMKNLGIVLAYDLKKNSEAAADFEKYLAAYPDDPDADAIRQEIISLRKQ
ncbi:MAG: tetratricopeptide repeat protein [Actinomycetota bacterium]|nr:tetratricopeptide repeat protein [Actinomycetota bacterium]